MAFGVEFRHETQRDDRDADLDGTNIFTDMIDGAISISNLSAVSSNPDTRGERDVASAYLEFAVPVVSPEMSIPLVHNLEFQVAGRVEHYSDFGDVAKPKVAMAWDIVDGLRLRASYSEGFRAPNLEQTNATTYSRLASNNDYLRCEADLRAGRIATFNACARSVSYSLRVSGNPDLKPEESTNQSVGLVFEPRFLPESMGDFTFTVDRWRIQQEDIVGLIGGQTAVVQDYLARLNGSSNPNVVRAAPNVDDIAFFAGTGIDPVGAIQFVSDGFVNLLPQDVQGVDFAVHWRLRDTPWGDFRAQVNVAQLLEFHRDAGPTVQALDEARDAGAINPATPLPIASDLLGRNGRPEYKVSSTLTWSHGPVQIGAFVQYTSAVEETGFLSTTGDAWVVESQTTANLYGQYEFDDAGWASNTRIRVGARNITDEAPPLTSSGYLGSLYRPYGRYWYASITKTF
ncbi:MAG: TonB-dependent receptor [bacterium]|nr:TonB-dependent receptor [bacterium]